MFFLSVLEKNRQQRHMKIPREKSQWNNKNPKWTWQGLLSMIFLWSFSPSDILNFLLPCLYFLLTNVDQLTGAVHGEMFLSWFCFVIAFNLSSNQFIAYLSLTACDPLSLYCQQRSTVCFPGTRKQREIPYKIHKLTMVGTWQIREGIIISSQWWCFLKKRFWLGRVGELKHGVKNEMWWIVSWTIDFAGS